MNARVPTHAEVVDRLANGAQALLWLAELAQVSPSQHDYLAVATNAHAKAAGLSAELGALLGAEERFPVPAPSLARALAYSREARS